MAHHGSPGSTEFDILLSEEMPQESASQSYASTSEPIRSLTCTKSTIRSTAGWERSRRGARVLDRRRPRRVGVGSLEVEDTPGKSPTNDAGRRYRRDDDLGTVCHRYQQQRWLPRSRVVGGHPRWPSCHSDVRPETSSRRDRNRRGTVSAHIDVTNFIGNSPTAAARDASSVIGSGVSDDLAIKAMKSKASNYLSNPHAIASQAKTMVQYVADVGKTDGIVSNKALFHFDTYDTVSK